VPSFNRYRQWIVRESSTNDWRRGWQNYRAEACHAAGIDIGGKGSLDRLRDQAASSQLRNTAAWSGTMTGAALARWNHLIHWRHIAAGTVSAMPAHLTAFDRDAVRCPARATFVEHSTISFVVPDV
jgi:hypothetical protein